MNGGPKTIDGNREINAPKPTVETKKVRSGQMERNDEKVWTAGSRIGGALEIAGANEGVPTRAESFGG